MAITLQDIDTLVLENASQPDHLTLIYLLKNILFDEKLVEKIHKLGESNNWPEKKEQAVEQEISPTNLTPEQEADLVTKLEMTLRSYEGCIQINDQQLLTSEYQPQILEQVMEILNELNHNYMTAYKSIIELIISDFEKRQNEQQYKTDDPNQAVMVRQIQIDGDQLI